MAVALRASATTAFTAATSVVVTKPAGTADDDILAASIGIADEGSGIGTITPPTGWTEIDRGNANAGNTMRVYWKRAASEGADYTWSSTVTQGWRAIISAWTGGVTTGDGYEPNPVVESTGSDTTVEHTGVTVSRNGSELLATNVRASNDTVTDHGGMTLVVKVSSIIQDREDEDAGASGTRTITFDASNAWASWMVALMPPAAAAVIHHYRTLLGVGR